MLMGLVSDKNKVYAQYEIDLLETFFFYTI